MRIVVALVTPFKRVHRTSKPSPSHHFYEQGFTAHEITALQSIFHNEDTQRSKKDK